jgi:hypothetical protein
MRYLATGFIPITEPKVRRQATAAAVTIAKGDVLHWSAGTLTNAVLSFAATFAGVAAADCASGGTVEYYPADQEVQYIVRCDANTVLVSATHVGTNVDVELAGTIDISNTITEGWAFQIDRVDISAAALAAHADAFGYAIGHFRVIGTQAG